MEKQIRLDCLLLALDALAYLRILETPREYVTPDARADLAEISFRSDAYDTLIGRMERCGPEAVFQYFPWVELRRLIRVLLRAPVGGPVSLTTVVGLLDACSEIGPKSREFWTDHMFHLRRFFEAFASGEITEADLQEEPAPETATT